MAFTSIKRFFRREWQVHLPPYDVCPRCRFDLRGTPDQSRCTECGLDLPDDGCAIMATNPRPWSIVLMNALLAAILLSCLFAAFVQIVLHRPGPPAFFWAAIAPGFLVLFIIRRLAYDSVFFTKTGMEFYRAGVRTHRLAWNKLSRIRFHGRNDGDHHPVMFSAYGLMNGFISLGTNHAAAEEARRRMDDLRASQAGSG